MVLVIISAHALVAMTYPTANSKLQLQDVLDDMDFDVKFNSIFPAHT